MNLSEKNIEEWKASITKLVKDKFGIEDYGNCMSNKEWLENHKGYSEEEALEEERQYWDE